MVFVAAAAMFFILKFCRTQTQKKVAVSVVAGVLLALLIWNRLSVALLHVDVDDAGNVVSKSVDWQVVIPNSFCSISAFLLSLGTLIFYKNRSNALFHCVVYVAFLGGLATVLFPEVAFAYGEPNIFGPKTFSMLLFHSTMWFLALLLITTGEFKPNWRKWWCMALGLCGYVAYGLFLMQGLKFGIQMEIQGVPFIVGTPLYWYVAGPIAILIAVIVSVCYEYIPKHLAKRKQNVVK